MSDNLIPLIKKIREIREFILSDKPLRIIQAEGLNHFQKSFTNQGFTDKTLKKWPKRKPPRFLKGTALKKWQTKDAMRAILVSHATRMKGTHMKDSIKAQIVNNVVGFSNDKIYSQVHNDGLLAGRAPGFTMPQRQFIGPSQQLEKNIQTKLEKEILKIFNQPI